jgi:hypothetical protein
LAWKKIWFSPQNVIVIRQIRAILMGNIISVDALRMGLVLRKVWFERKNVIVPAAFIGIPVLSVQL